MSQQVSEETTSPKPVDKPEVDRAAAEKARQDQAKQNPVDRPDGRQNPQTPTPNRY